MKDKKLRAAFITLSKELGRPQSEETINKGNYFGYSESIEDSIRRLGNDIWKIKDYLKVNDGLISTKQDGSRNTKSI